MGQQRSHRASKWHLTPLSSEQEDQRERERERPGDQTVKTFTPKSAALKENSPNGEIIYELFAVHLKIPLVELCLATRTALKSMEWQ